MIQPITFTVSEACAAAHIGRTALYNALRSEELRTVKRGRRTLIPVKELHRHNDGLPPFEPRSDWLTALREKTPIELPILRID
jgi:excisionase family DNA binding protein